MDFGLDIVDSVGRLDLEGDSLPCEGLDEDLHLQGYVALGDEIRNDGLLATAWEGLYSQQFRAGLHVTIFAS